MAQPPEPLERLLPYAEVVVEATVVEVLETRDDATPVDAPPGHVDVGREAGSQILLLRVDRCLKGSATGEIQVEKPVAPYVVEEGTSGPFLLARKDGGWGILGRYGPLYRDVGEVEQALATSAS